MELFNIIFQACNESDQKKLLAALKIKALSVLKWCFILSGANTTFGVQNAAEIHVVEAKILALEEWQVHPMHFTLLAAAFTLSKPAPFVLFVKAWTHL